MNKLRFLSLALSALMLSGMGTATLASAARQGRGNSQWETRERDSQRGRGSQWDTRARDFTGVWRIEDRKDRRNDGFDLRRQVVSLPNVIRIERSRRELRVENRNGSLLRTLETGRRGDWEGNRLEVETRMGGTRVTETFSLREGGDELVVRTVVEGRRGTQRFTSVYERA